MSDFWELGGVIFAGAASCILLAVWMMPARSRHTRLCLTAQDSPEHHAALARQRRATLAVVTAQMFMLSCIVVLHVHTVQRHNGYDLYARLMLLADLAIGALYVYLWRGYGKALRCYDLKAMEQELNDRVHRILEAMGKARQQWRSN